MIPEIQYIKGIGPKRAALLNKYGIKSFWDLIEYFPRRYLDRSRILPLDKLSKDTEVTVIGKIEAAGIRRSRKPVFYLVISDGKGILEAIWFNYVNQYKTMFKVGEWISLSGKIGFYRGFQMVHPDYDKLGNGDFENLINTGKIIPLYPGGEAFKKAGLNSYTFRRIFHSILSNYLQEIPEVLSERLINQQDFLSRKESFRNIHSPVSEDYLARSIKRFKYEEFFFIQLMLALQKLHTKKDEPGYAFEKPSKNIDTLYDQLPFNMTTAQKRVVKELRADMKWPHPMNRILQGDVGSGKTLVAMMAMLIGIDNGYQVALMVPTEVLAEQHYYTISTFLKDLDIRIGMLTGNTPTRERQLLQAHINSQDPLIVIGTHALIQENVIFSKLGLIIIDEQHRFGVMQRSTLVDKGIQAHILMMTATPIPRTLAFTIYGNLDVSTLDEMPPNRPAVQTYWRFDDKTEEINEFIIERVDKGEQVFIVYPLVEESEKIDLKAATESYNQYKINRFARFNTALLHGQMKSEEKEKIMHDFSKGNIDILFSTTVIEVGVDVQNATIMVIEHSERFGLSQLHQLRGRVGRGLKKSYCILKTPYQVSETAQKRLQIMTETSDGFQIAEEDLRIRGWGDFFGTRQSGLPVFKIANPVLDQDILQTARRDAFEIVNIDPHLRKDENNHLKEYFISQYKEKVKYFNIS
jgi:ATP-dependent DNA helicase RecG